VRLIGAARADLSRNGQFLITVGLIGGIGLRHSLSMKNCLGMDARNPRQAGILRGRAAFSVPHQQPVRFGQK